MSFIAFIDQFVFDFLYIRWHGEQTGAAVFWCRHVCDIVVAGHGKLVDNTYWIKYCTLKHVLNELEF